jgi:hypothetical protein
MAKKSKMNGALEDSINRTPSEEGDGRAADTGHKDTIELDAIAARAYQIYEREGRADGKDLDHWLKAEAELRAERESQGQQAGTRPTQPGSQASQPTAPRSARLQQENQDGAGRPSAAQSGLQSGMAGSR